ncbi:hypothetical protein N9A72_00440 [bacterium]|nr:hypothetical protein [bacterium]
MKKLTPVKAIRQYCIECCNNQKLEVRLCTVAKDCPLYLLRMGKRPRDSRPLKVIRKKCADCSGGLLKEVKNCTFYNCQLYPYRFGYKSKKVEYIKGF